MKPLITILTPTYNRDSFLTKCYKSLINQTVCDFEWLVIDDGSTDNTSQFIDQFIKESSFPIRYYRKNNGGKHTALNVGFKKARGELTIILDSDDTLVSDAIEIIRCEWNKLKSIENLSSIVFLRGYANGKIIGDTFPRDYYISNHIDCRINMGVIGDKSEVYITKVLQKYRFPEFKEEKFLSEGYVWYQMGKEYSAVYINKVIYITEYLEGGLTKSGRKLRILCPLGGIEAAKQGMNKPIIFKQRVKHTLLYLIYSFFAEKKISEIIKYSNNRILSLVLILPAFLGYLIWKKKYI